MILLISSYFDHTEQNNIKIDKNYNLTFNGILMEYMYTHL